MAETKTYSLICPDPDCEEEFDVHLTPEALVDDADLILCPACGEEWEWEYDAAADTLELLGDEAYEADELALDGSDDDDEEDETP